MGIRHSTACVRGLRLPGVAALLLPLLILAGCGESGRQEKVKEEKMANVILVTVDTLRADRLGCYGNEYIKTPMMDSLAAKGVVFEKAYCQVPTTGPSHSSILTSLYPREHGVLNNTNVLDDRFTTLPEILKGRGYKTAAFLGVWVLEAKYGFSQGVDEFSVSEDEKRPEEVTRWLAKNKNGPFFLWLHLFAPHRPYQPPIPYDTMYDADYKGGYDGSVKSAKEIYDKKVKLGERDLRHIKALYDSEVSYTDSLLSKIFAAVDENGLADNTLIVLTADHGEVLYEHEYYFGHSFSLYDPAIRVPLIMVYPGVLPEGRRVGEQVESVDIAPTVLDVLGMVKQGGSFHGKSLLPAVTGGWKAAPAFSETFAPEGRENKGAVNSGGWKLLKYQDDSRLEMYDIMKDPAENDDLAHSEKERLAEMEGMLDGFVHRFENPAADGKAKPDEETRKKLKSLGYVQ